MFFNSWADLGRVIVTGVLAYVGLIAFLRVSGKRTLSKMNMFDFVVTVAFGSTLATVLLSEQVALAEGLVAFLTLIGLQFVTTWLSVRFDSIKTLVKSQPALLFYQGHYLEEALLEQRVTREAVRQAMRQGGYASLSEVLAVVLETDGTFSAIPYADEALPTALEDVADQLPPTAPLAESESE